MRDFRKLEFWHLGMEIVEDVYKVLPDFPKAESYGLRSQVGRCAISMPSNVAEGCSRSGSKDTARFFEIAIGSAFELETQLIASVRIGFLDSEKIDPIIMKTKEFQAKTNSYRIKILS